MKPALVVALALVVAAMTGCHPVGEAGKTDQIQLVGTTTVDGYKFDQYRNLAYPCSISGYQTFVIGTKVGSSDTETRPLWVRMRGGGVGYFDSTGTPQPSAGNKSEESAATSISFLNPNGLMELVRNDPLGFRLVSVSMCNHDIYAGGDQPDPNNPNTLPDGSGRTVNGLFATKAAIQFARAKYPTSKFFLQGTSAGSAGSLGVSWGLQEQGIPPAGTIADSGVVNIEWEKARHDQGTCSDFGSDRDAEALAAIRARSQFQLADIDNEPDKLVSRGVLEVPLIHIWNSADSNVCGATQMSCPLRDGSTVPMGSANCVHEPLRAAIAGLGAGTPSRNMRVCVSNPPGAGTCTVHVVTTRHVQNTDPSSPADYVGAIMDWVHARLND
jgi:hypothetical protein